MSATKDPPSFIGAMRVSRDGRRVWVSAIGAIGGLVDEEIR